MEGDFYCAYVGCGNVVFRMGDVCYKHSKKKKDIDTEVYLDIDGGLPFEGYIKLSNNPD